MLSGPESIQVGMKLDDKEHLPSMHNPGVFPSIRKERNGEAREKKTSILHGQRYNLHTAFLFWKGIETRASCVLSMTTELHHQRLALKVKMAEQITELHNSHIQRTCARAHTHTRIHAHICIHYDNEILNLFKN